MSARILIADPLSPRAEEILREAGLAVDVKVGLKPAELKAILPAYDGLAVRSATKVTAELLEAATRLKLIGRAGIGVDNIDVPAASRRGVVVMNTPSGNAVTTAEHALALMMALARRIPQATASLKAGRWEKKKFQGSELCDKTLGLIGLGNIGRIVADRARGLRLKVIAYDPFISEEAAAKLGAELVPFDRLLARADIVSVHTPLTPDTRGLIGAQALKKCKPGVLIINAARGGIVDEAALAQALGSGQVAGAALDVFVDEPPQPDHPLLALDSVICTPHLGASTEEAQEKVAIEVAEQMVAYFLRGEVRNAVNLPAIPRELRERLAPHVDLAEKLGALAGQLVGGNIDQIAIEVSGEPAEAGAKTVVAAALAGLLRSHLDVPVNEVNAPVLAADRGIRLSETRRARGENFASAVALRASGRGWSRYVMGTIFQIAERAEPRVVVIDDFLLEIAPEGRILVLRNEDKPGVIGSVGTFLGARGINVSRMQVGLAPARQEALQLWNIDGELTEAMLQEIRRLPHVRAAQQVTL
ncbi:MAG TPA: phosphoglycerate dehydrogenase [Polyangia bacterium]|nr:phosphoglycerate dehydrogenase [Polyangia bacterium]